MEPVKQLVQAVWHRRDPRVRLLPLQSSPALFLAFLAAYIVMIVYGPRVMRHKRRPSLKYVMPAYNLFQVTLSMFMLYELTANSPTNWTCAPMEISRSARSTRIMNAVILFHYSKLADFLDTLFLVLKKDFRRMSYLHTFHHASMFFNFWLATLYTPGDPAWMECAMNSFVHCIMYSYYFLASMGPRVQKLLWWKKYLTQLQLAQFVCMLLHLLLMQVPGFRCHVPVWAVYISFVYVLILCFLFINFYIHCYKKAQKSTHACVPAGDQTTAPPGDHTAVPSSTCPKTATTWSQLMSTREQDNGKQH